MSKLKASKELIYLLMCHFNGDKKKVDMWLITPNPLLGGAIPRYMIEVGRESKLIDHVQSCISGNYYE